MNPPQETSRQVEITLGKDQPEALAPVVERILTLVEARRDKANRLVDAIVAINESAPDVGKSYTSSAIGRALLERNIYARSIPDLAFAGSAIEDVRHELHVNYRNGAIMLLNACGTQFGGKTADIRNAFRRRLDIYLQNVTEGACECVDLWLGVYRPDLPFHPPFVIADYLIRNEGAFDKPCKFRQRHLR